MSGRRKPRDVAAPSGMTLADYKASGALNVPLPALQYMVRTKDGHQFSVHPHTPEGLELAQLRAGQIGGSVEEYKPNPTTYWKTGETHYDH